MQPSIHTLKRDNLKQLKDMRDNEDLKGSLSSGKTLRSSSMDNITTIAEENNKPIPWYKKVNPEKMALVHYVKKNGIEKVLRDDVGPLATAEFIELLISPDTPPQVRLQTAQAGLNKIIGDKINIPQLNKAFNVSQHIDNLVIKQTIINQAISKSDNNGVIDITDNDE